MGRYSVAFVTVIVVLFGILLGSSINAKTGIDLPRKASVDADLLPKGYQQVTSLSSAAALTVPSGSYLALIQAEDQNVRWRDDGTLPTDAVGMQISVGNEIWYIGDLDAIRFIEEAASAKLNVSYYAL